MNFFSKKNTTENIYFKKQERESDNINNNLRRTLKTWNLRMTFTLTISVMKLFVLDNNILKMNDPGLKTSKQAHEWHRDTATRKQNHPLCDWRNYYGNTSLVVKGEKFTEGKFSMNNMHSFIILCIDFSKYYFIKYIIYPVNVNELLWFFSSCLWKLI